MSQADAKAAALLPTINTLEEGPAVGRIVGIELGRLMVEFGSKQAPVAARSVVPMSSHERLCAAERNAEVLLLFVDGDRQQPIITGLLQPEESIIDLVLEPSAEDGAAAEMAELTVDGEPHTISARDELVLRCGEASITLRRNGRIVLRGNYIESHSRGTNRIKGGSVRIN